MRMLRHVLAVLAALLLLGGLAPAVLSPAAAAGPKRVIDEEKPRSVAYAYVRLQGNVTQPVTDPLTGAVTYERYTFGKVKVHRKKCRACKWKFYKRDKTNKYGTYKVRVRVPERGIWRYRVTIPGSDGYATTRTRPRAVFYA